MKPLLFALGLLLGGTAPLYAQKPATSVAPVTLKYCLLYTLSSSLVNTGLRLDYGQGQRKEMTVQDVGLAVLAGNIERFTSVAAALSYLDAPGWKLVTTTAFPEDQTSYGNYLLRRKP